MVSDELRPGTAAKLIVADPLLSVTVHCESTVAGTVVDAVSVPDSLIPLTVSVLSFDDVNPLYVSTTEISEE
jgi:hypothetical protein